MVAAASRDEAEKISCLLLEKKLVACANLIHRVTSLFWWKRRIERADECIVLTKTRFDLFKELTEAAKSVHSYEVPEIIAFPIVEASKEYLDWIDSSLK